MLRAMEDPDDVEARTNMILASTIAGVGFGSAGVTLPHGMSYPISGLVRDYRPEGYLSDHPLIPHGMAVILGAPAAFRFMAPANPGACLRGRRAHRRRHAGRRPGRRGRTAGPGRHRGDEEGGHAQRAEGRRLHRGRLPALVEGVLPQHRVTKLSPRPATADDFRQLFLDSMTIWYGARPGGPPRFNQDGGRGPSSAIARPRAGRPLQAWPSRRTHGFMVSV